VYRDGFGIRVGEDWLNLGRQQTSGGSVYGLRPKNVIGFIAISARENRLLLETTSREGFQKTPHFLNFYALLQNFVSWSSQAQEYLRRGALEFLKNSRTRDAGLEVGGEIQSAAKKLRKQAAEIDHREQKLVNTRESMRQFAMTAKARIQEIIDGDKQLSLFHQEKLKKVDELVLSLDAAVERMQQTLDEYHPEATTITRAEQILNVVLERDARLRQELEMFYEGVALGLTAEALSHEIAGVAERLAQRSSMLGSYLSQQKNRDNRALGFVEHVKSSVAALRKQLSHLDPALRYVRERREVVEVAREIQETQDFYKERFSGHGITMTVQVESSFNVQINKGKLSQVFDNMLLNSEYWLREARRRNTAFSGTIIVQVDRPTLCIWDNGPGIALSVEDNLFDPFVTTKEQGKGRGLGLFIVRQLLDAEGCSIRLLPERNGAGRRFKFEIDFRGALHE
jgi:signal transduction histidine kinase